MLVRIDNAPRDYAWGSRTAIAELLGREPSGGPEAELWLGTHPGSPARVVGGGALTGVAGDLPYLLKVLAAAAPLSLQAHPTTDQARIGFAREEAAGIPRDAAHRNYRDPHAKPEMIYALSDPFRALCGFRSAAETRTVVAAVGDPGLTPLVSRLDSDAAIGDVFSWLLGGGDEVAALVAAACDAAARVAGTGADDPSWASVRLLAEHYPGDPGVAISLLLHSVALRPGEALYLPAGNIHAYLDGVGIELMGPSDNVLRGGLTAKHIDAAELATVLDTRPLPVPYLTGVPVAPGVTRFRAPDAPLQLDAVDGGSVEAAVGSIVLAIDEARVAGEVLPAGTAAYLPEAAPVSSEGRAFVAGA